MKKRIWNKLIAGTAAAAMLASYRLWVKLSERALAEGGKCVSARWHSRLQYGLCAGALMLAGTYFAVKPDSPGSGSFAYGLVSVSALIMVVALVNLFANYLRTRGVSKTANAIGSGAVCVALMILALFLLKAAGNMF